MDIKRRTMDISSSFKRSLPTDIQSDPRWRKCRKGTQSCWACKRRKVRCDFASKTDAKCDRCKIRNIACVSQEYPDEPGKVDSNSPLHERLGRVEALVDRLARRIHISEEAHDGTTSLDGFCKPNSTDYEPKTERVTPKSSSEHPSGSQNAGPGNTDEYQDIRNLLLNAWPDQRILEILLDVPGDILGVCHGTICAPLSKVCYKNSTVLREIMQLPPSHCHPLLIARKLLRLATYLQSLSPARIRHLERLGVDCSAIMSSMFQTARRYVTCNEDFLGSIEGVECLILESMYQNNAGKLRSAWHSTRRAMLIAQMMGIHQGSGTRFVKVLEAETWNRVNTQHMWFRLMQINRYLSLTLGMLQGTPNNSFAELHVLDACTPVERMQRMDCVVGGHILQRNEAGLYDTATTHMIDQLLQKSAACLPPSWWTAPVLEPSPADVMETLEALIRVMDQVTHYHLVTQLHFPHLLQSTEHEYDYSKILAANASREILTRYTSQRDVHSFKSWCRGISFVAFIACVAICIVHLGAVRQRREQGNGTFLDMFENQHQSDRNMMEFTLECMQSTADECKDPIASKTALILGQLLSMEAHDAVCTQEETNSSIGDSEYQFGYDSRVTECGQTLYINITSFGTLKFERGVAMNSVGDVLGSSDLPGQNFFHNAEYVGAA